VSFLGDARSSLGDAKSSLGTFKFARQRESHAPGAQQRMEGDVMPRNGLLEHGEAAGKQLRSWTLMWARGKSRVCSSTTTPPVAIRWGLWIFCRRTCVGRGWERVP
jgi:hypothetical protein